MTRNALSAFLSLLVFLGCSAAPVMAQVPGVQAPTPAPAAAQPRPSSEPGPPAIVEFQDAQQTREELRQLLQQHPPSVGTVLRSDPSLAAPEYLAPYPALVEFIQRHPEVTRNPAYFFGTPDGRDFQRFQPQDRSVEMFDTVMEGFVTLLIAGAIIGVFTWLIRFFVDHRRWLRVSRTQADVHTKLLDRFSNNEDLMAYIQTPAGRRFLESAPIALDEKPRSIGAPMSRILWSMQAGVVLASLGVGFFMAQTRFPDDMGDGFYIMGMLVAWLGIGFGVSAVLAYIISSRFGLVTPSRPAATND